VTAPALELLDVVRRYRAGVPGCSAEVTALAGLSLTVHPAECVGIAGGPGAGKTTLLLCAAGILPPDAGSVRGVRAAFVPVMGSAHPYLSLRAALDLAATLRELAGCDEAHDVDGAIARAALTHVAEVRLGQLTPGLRARASLAHALLGEPRLLCLDDPLAALDAAERRRYGALLERFRADGLAILVTARDGRRLAGIATRVVTLEAGRVATPAAGARTLELEVGMPRHAAAALARKIPSVRRLGRSLRVPLGGISAEEVLSACLSLGISVYGSRVVTTPATGKVAEGPE